MEGHDLCEDLLKKDIRVDLLLGYKYFILEERVYVNERGEVLSRYYSEVIIIFWGGLPPCHQDVGNDG